MKGMFTLALRKEGAQFILGLALSRERINRGRERERTLKKAAAAWRGAGKASTLGNAQTESQ